MRRFHPIHGLLAASLSVPLLGAPGSPPLAADEDCGLIEASAGDEPSLTVANGNGVLQLRKKGKRVRATLDGRPVPEERLVRDGATLRVLGEGGLPLFMVVLYQQPAPDGQVVYVHEMDPYSTLSRLGLRARPLDPELAAHLQLEPGTALKVTGICRDLPAAGVDLQEEDILVAVNGQSPVTEELLSRAALRAGAPVMLDVLRQGRRLRVSLTPAEPAPWPDPDRLESYAGELFGR